MTPTLAQHPGSAAALTELRTLFEFLDAMGALGPIVFDLSLARGLDYYTGVIYEAVLQVWTYRWTGGVDMNGRCLGKKCLKSISNCYIPVMPVTIEKNPMINREGMLVPLQLEGGTTVWWECSGEC